MKLCKLTELLMSWYGCSVRCIRESKGDHMEMWAWVNFIATSAAWENLSREPSGGKARTRSGGVLPSALPSPLTPLTWPRVLLSLGKTRSSRRARAPGTEGKPGAGVGDGPWRAGVELLPGTNRGLCFGGCLCWSSGNKVQTEVVNRALELSLQETSGYCI